MQTQILKPGVVAGTVLTQYACHALMVPTAYVRSHFTPANPENTDSQQGTPSGPDIIERATALIKTIAEQVRSINALRRQWNEELHAELSRLAGRVPGPHVGKMRGLQKEIAAHDEAMIAAGREMLAMVESAGVPGLGELAGAVIGHDRHTSTPVVDPDGERGQLTAINDDDGTVQVTYPDGSAKWHPSEQVKDAGAGAPLAFD